MISEKEALIEAQKDAIKIAEHATSNLIHNKDLNDKGIIQAYHYIVAETHVDPDHGREYVPLNEPVNTYRQQKISKRNKKVHTLIEELLTSLTSGLSPFDVQAELNAKQQFPAIRFALTQDELVTMLREWYMIDYCYPGHLEVVFYQIISESEMIFGWEEAISCEGGITDRYKSVQLERDYNKQ